LTSVVRDTSPVVQALHIMKDVDGQFSIEDTTNNQTRACALLYDKHMLLSRRGIAHVDLMSIDQHSQAESRT